MTCTRINNGILCSSSDSEHQIIDHTGKTWRFEFGRFGPLILTPKHGHTSDDQPDESTRWKPFWKAFHAWLDKRKGDEK